MKLHYSQTKTGCNNCLFTVLIPYEITLFSNHTVRHIHIVLVLIPYEITLFSNILQQVRRMQAVLIPYEITLFSNTLGSL